MTLIDTHAHIYLDDFSQDKEAIIQRADREGVVKILMPAIDASTHEQMLSLEAEFPGKCMSMMGLHPVSVKENVESELEIIQNYLAKRRFVAVGEIGLDFHWDLSHSAQQYKAFHQQIEWALHYDLPIVIHSRQAIDECLKIVAGHQKGALRGAFHCFSGDLRQAREAMDLGFFLGIGGVLTFKNSGLDKIMKEIGLEQVILETDAPYLAPVPFRGKRNEPSYLKYVVQRISELCAISEEEIAVITMANTQKLFGQFVYDQDAYNHREEI